MNLPNYFFADLPPEAVIGPTMITEACQALKRNRETYLAHRSTQAIVEVLSRLAKDWLDPEFSFRKLALSEGPAATGFSRGTIATGLDRHFKRLTPEGFQALIEQDLGKAERLDHFTSTTHEQQGNRASLATGPELIAHVAAGNLPNPTLTSIVLGLLVRSAQFVKCASGASLLPRLFAHSLYEIERKFGACLEIAEWKGGNDPLERTLFEAADCVTATGSDESLAGVRCNVPGKVRFLGFGSRVSFGYVAHEMLTGVHLRRVVERVAADVAAWDQQGCLSPHVIYVQARGTVPGEKFAEMLADQLAEHELREPRGPVKLETSAHIASRRSIYELRAASSPDTRLWCSKESTAWTVVYESDPRFQISCLNRFVYVKEVKDFTEALQAADVVRGRVSTIGLAVPEHTIQTLCVEAARWGATRICPLGQMQDPPLAWRHDGAPALATLITWTDWEQ
ncbi:MAG TPA: acyl-CoA reductase [Verrucomicrobiae bacterium]|nr:acyl-CoA reductase [Verrucomicrobiae bacterium]